MAASKLPWIRLGVAQNINTPTNILEQLTRDKETVIKLAAIQNPMMPTECLKAFCDTKDKKILDIIGNHPNVPAAFFKENRVWDFVNNPHIPSSVFEKLAKSTVRLSRTCGDKQTLLR